MPPVSFVGTINQWRYDTGPRRTCQPPVHSRPRLKRQCRVRRGRGPQPPRMQAVATVRCRKLANTCSVSQIDGGIPHLLAQRALAEARIPGQDSPPLVKTIEESQCDRQYGLTAIRADRCMDRFLGEHQPGRVDSRRSGHGPDIPLRESATARAGPCCRWPPRVAPPGGRRAWDRDSSQDRSQRRTVARRSQTPHRGVMRGVQGGTAETPPRGRGLARPFRSWPAPRRGWPGSRAQSWRAWRTRESGRRRAAGIRQGDEGGG